MIHQYKLNGYNIVLDVNSASIHVVDDIAYDIINLFETKNKKQIILEVLAKYAHMPDVNENELNECINQIHELKNKGKLFSSANYEKITTEKTPEYTLKAMCLHVAHTCNLTCSYCFAAQGKYNGKNALMSFETGKAAFDFLIKNSKGRKNLEVDFFGGEPLMNFDVVKQLVKYAKETEEQYNKNFRFTFTTNGVLLNDDIINFLNKEMHNVVLSLDGRKHIHDKYRVDFKNNGSYDIIVPKFKRLVLKRGDKNYYMRGTFTKDNLNFTQDVLHMANLGFTQLSMEPMVGNENDENALNSEHLPVLFKEYEILAKEMLLRKKQGKPFEFYHYILDLQHGPCIHKRIKGCASGTEYMAVTPTGELYPCHQFVGDKKYLLGNVFDEKINKQIQDEFDNCNIFTQKECEHCWAKFYCAGGCAANNYHATGDINKVHEFGCELFKKRIECAIYYQIAQYDEE